MLAAGGIVAIAALGVLLSAAVAGVAALLMSMGMGEAAASGIAALIVGGIVAIIAYVLIKRGTSALKAQNLGSAVQGCSSSYRLRSGGSYHLPSCRSGR